MNNISYWPATMFARIREECKIEYVESMDEEWQLQVLMGNVEKARKTD